MKHTEFVNRLNLIYGTDTNISGRIELVLNSQCVSSLFEIALVTATGPTRKFIIDLRNIIVGDEGKNTDLVYDIFSYVIETLDLKKAEAARLMRNTRHLQQLSLTKPLTLDEEVSTALLHIFRTLPDQAHCARLLKHLAGHSDISLYAIWEIFHTLVEEISDWEVFKLSKKAEEVKDIINVDDFFSVGQIKSKLWAIDKVSELDLDIKNVIVHAGWAGLYPYLTYIRNGCSPDMPHMTCVDIDGDLAEVATSLNTVLAKHDKFTFLAEDSITYEYTGDLEGLAVVNTSCEHIEDFDTWYGNIPDGAIVVLQSNNFDDEEHIGGDYHVDTLEEFKNSIPLTTTLYTGELELMKYSRFMVVGVK